MIGDVSGNEALKVAFIRTGRTLITVCMAFPESLRNARTLMSYDPLNPGTAPDEDSDSGYYLLSANSPQLDDRKLYLNGSDRAFDGNPAWFAYASPEDASTAFGIFADLIQRVAVGLEGGVPQTTGLCVADAAQKLIGAALESVRRTQKLLGNA